MKPTGLAVLIWLGAWGASAQQTGWGDLDALLFPALTRSGTAEASYFLPNAAAPETATEALGIVYEHVEGSAGTTTIAVGHFVKNGQGFSFAGRVSNLFGLGPRDAAFFPDRIEVTTTTLRETDPRCCPTGETRYVIDRATLVATPLN